MQFNDFEKKMFISKIIDQGYSKNHATYMFSGDTEIINAGKFIPKYYLFRTCKTVFM